MPSPPPSLEEKLLMALVRASELFKRRSAAIFREHGLSFSQYNALRALGAEPKGEASLGQVGRSMLVSGPNLSGIAKRLEAGGFVQRRPAPGDERKKLMKLTARGRRVLQQIQRKQEANIQAMVGAYPQEQKRLLLATLRQILASG